MYFRALFFLSSISFVHASFLNNPQAVVVKVPVADSLGTSAQIIDPSLAAQNNGINNFYENLAFSPETGPYSCGRMHQFIFNEVGVINEELGDEVRLSFPHISYLDGQQETRSDFWMQKKNIEKITAMSEDLRRAIPESLSAENGQVLSLVLPWYNEQTGYCYSAGTRFVRRKEYDTATHFGICMIDYAQNSTIVSLVPHDKAITDKPVLIQAHKELFLKILRTWLNNQNGIIPYVFGGCSMCGPIAPEFHLWKGTRNGTEITNWQRPGHHPICFGFDCSGLILRAAQLAGIAYFAKNTTMLGVIGTDVPSDEPLENGDLMLIKGHVMVISDIENNLFIDSVSYSSGYGCLREVPLSHFFTEISTYVDVRNSIATQQQLNRKNRAGNVVGAIPWIRIIRLSHQHHP